MRFEAAHNKSVIMTGGITIVKKVLLTNEIQPKMVALYEGDLFRKAQGGHRMHPRRCQRDSSKYN